MQPSIVNALKKKSKKRERVTENKILKDFDRQTIPPQKRQASSLLSLLEKANAPPASQGARISQFVLQSATDTNLHSMNKGSSTVNHQQRGATMQTQRTTFNQPHPHHKDVRTFKSSTIANRLLNPQLLSSNRSLEQEAAWQSNAGARRAAVSRISQATAEEQRARVEHLSTEKIRIAAEVAAKEAALRAKKQAEEMRRIRFLEEQPREVRDKMWPRTNFEGAIYGDDFDKWREDQQQKRAFNGEDPDDCWGRGHARGEGDNQTERDDGNDGREHENFDHFDAWDHFEGGGGGYSSTDDDGDDNGEGGEFDWDEFFSQYARQGTESSDQQQHSSNAGSNHHHHHNNNTNGTNNQQTGAPPPQQQSAHYVCSAAATEAALSAVEASTRAGVAATEEEAVREEVHAAVLEVARHCGYAVIAFATAFKIHVSNTGGAVAAKRKARRGLLMTLHPDKLQHLSSRQQYLGTCVMQVLNSAVNR